MKKRMMRVFTVIITFSLLISMFIKVEATNINTNSLSEEAVIYSDTSGPVSITTKITKVIISLLKYLMLISGIFLLIYGIKVIVKNKQKRGIIYIMISIGLLFECIMLDAIHICDHNIM